MKMMLIKSKSVSFLQHLLIGMLIRLILIIYSEIQDKISEVPYTDIDYQVVTDGARYVLQHESPFKRHTYRYSPLLAYVLIPNIIFHRCFGKVLFSLFDVLVGFLIGKIVGNELRIDGVLEKAKSGTTNNQSKWVKTAAIFWLYNPLSMVIATRGNGDSISSFFVLLTLYFIQTSKKNNLYSFLAGICHGVAIHLRIYPLIFSLALFLSLSTFEIRIRSKNFWKRLLLTVPHLVKGLRFTNKRQILLILGTVLSLGTLTVPFYYLYGDEYINEAYLYHFRRRDIRHNFSLYFLMQYLGSDVKPTFWSNILTNLPRVIVLFYLSVTFGWSRKTLSFCMFCQAFVMVTYNPVVTSQYFVWYLSLLPLCIKNLKNISIKSAVGYFCVWLVAQGFWLLPAYLLEFKGFQTFNFIGIQSMCLFIANIYVLSNIISNFDVIILK